MATEKRLKDYKAKTKVSPLKIGLKKVVEQTGYSISKIPPKNLQNELPVTAKQWFDLYFSMVNPKDFFFIQLGANDGKSRDPMHDYIAKYKLRGILVEPQADIFEKLKATYSGHDNLAFANVAIAEVSGQQTFYQVKRSLVNEKNFFEATAISSLDKEMTKRSVKKRIPHVIEKISDNLDDYIEETTVKSLTFSDLLKHYQVEKLDFLFTDCDGYDHKIINMIDFDQMTPKVINYESCVLSDADRTQCENLLTGNGYQIFRHGNDTCAFKI